MSFPCLYEIRWPGLLRYSLILLALPLVLALPLSLSSGASATELPPAATGTVDYEKQVQPLLTAKCLDCHGEFLQESQFRLDRKASLLRGGDSGEPGVVIGKSADSHLIRLVAHLEADLAMPPDPDEKLTDEEVGLLRAWIDQGAIWPGPAGEVTAEKMTSNHWSFQPLKTVAVPTTDHSSARNPIDHFILSRLEAAGLSPNPPADRRTLIRRLSLDLHGLPPRPEAVEAFVKNPAPHATDDLIEDLLASPHYGERWARYWLDLVRFAETHGFETNRERPAAWPYRDYVIQSLNADKPYDQFIREQIAGDQFGNPTGLSFLVAGPYDQVKSPDINLTLMQRHNELDDMINTTGTTFLGLTFGCARCHNHKFDPVSQTDYYSLQAIFAGVKHGDLTLPLAPEKQARVKELKAREGALDRELAKYAPPAQTAALLLLDDEPEGTSTAVEQLQTRAGQGVNPGGTSRGHANDPGDPARTRNFSGGKYSWWKHKAAEPVLAWQPRVQGEYRVWLSWGSGHASHCQDARYVIDRDGNPATRDDWETIAVVNQQNFANGDSAGPSKSLWSGFFHAGIHSLEAHQRILLVGGKTGTAITADVLVLEAVAPETADLQPAQPTFRPAVAATGNTDRFPAHPARFVRFVIEATNSAQPCLDELEVYSGAINVALASSGAKPTASGSLAGHPIHQLKHINDGKSGNNHSWISDTSGGWVQIEFADVAEIDRIEWARDRTGKYADRLAIGYRIESSLNGVDWRIIASSADRLPYQSQQSTTTTPLQVEHLSADEATIARQLWQERESVRQQREALSQQPKIYAGQYSQPGPTHRLYRGEPLEKREEVAPGIPALFATESLAKDAPEADRRAALADWIASPENPLTARVIVNRLWQFHFGAGLVDTPSDFGAGGTLPSHPELLDWLAGELIAHHWSLKHIHRLILQSATYQQASTPQPRGLEIDGASRLLWRYPPHRLEAEPIRDSILSVTGALDLTTGGPGFSAFEIEAENVRHYHPKTSFGPSDWRRMIYMTKVRMEQDAVFGLFDCPDAATSVPQRTRSTTPLQALNLFNSGFVLQQAELFAQRLERAAETTEQRIQLAYELCYARPADTRELQACQAFIATHGWNAFCRALLNSNEFLFIP